MPGQLLHRQKKGGCMLNLTSISLHFFGIILTNSSLFLQFLAHIILMIHFAKNV